MARTGRCRSRCSRKAQPGHPLATAFNNCYCSRMSFSEEARELARELARKARAAEEMWGTETSLEAFIRRTKALIQRQFEERDLPSCVDKLIRWFDYVGMVPHPPLGTGERKERLGNRYDYYSERLESTTEYYVEITWRFDGYDYRASCPPAMAASQSLLGVEINVEGRWFQANSKEAIGWALLQEGRPPPPPPP
jgi:hypothetical protein